MIDKLVVIGVGLIGGSLALALQEAGKVRRVVGVGRTRANLERALGRGIVGAVCTLEEDWRAELADADLVMVAAPVAQMPELFAAMAGGLGPRTIVTDGGSTKQDVVAAARAALGPAFPRFVPAHPIAGTEHSGADAAFAALYRARTVVLTPVAETEAGAVATVRAMWEACGASVALLDAARHDAIFAAVSHAPHVLAFALVAGLSGRPDAEEYFRHAASGFRDFTRLASSSPEMWRDICIANRDAVRSELAAFRDQLRHVDSLLAAGDRAGLVELFAKARSARECWLAQNRRLDI